MLPQPLLVVVAFVATLLARSVSAAEDAISTGKPEHWEIKEGTWETNEDQAVATGAFALMLAKQTPPRDFTLAADVAYSHTAPHAASGLVFRLADDRTGYAVGLREVEKGEHPKFGPWERPVVQLYRWDRDGWKLLQESKVAECQSDRLSRLKVVCRGPNIYVFYQDMKVPVLKEYDERYERAGRVGLWKDHLGKGRYGNFVVSAAEDEPSPPLRTDWSWVRGAVYVRSNAVNSVEMWHDYWDHAAVVDRELSYASSYGFNMIQAYLHWIVWDRHRDEYLKRIDDFLARADKQGLKVNLIFWDDCGHVEPSLTFAAPVPGRHNSQMMPNPSHRIRDSETELVAHKERFREYVEGVARRFKDDRRIAFWQLYNEGMGAREQYRVGTTDANLTRLLAWTHAWVKATGTRLPVTATGGAFYGPKYSDFYTYHSYRGGQHPLPGADGGPEHLCTETLNRPAADLVACLHDLGGKQNGFVVWELMIGRDNCRFPWGHPDGRDEPAQPFHGVIYPDGHPWDVREIEALRGNAAFAALQKKLLRVEYFTGAFKAKKKTSVTPRIDFDLGDEPGYGSPDASAGIGHDDFSIRWTGNLVAPQTGAFTFFAESDGQVRLWIDEKRVLGKEEPPRREVRGEVVLKKDQTYAIKIEYVHAAGPASQHIQWSGPQFGKRVFVLSDTEPSRRQTQKAVRASR